MSQKRVKKFRKEARKTAQNELGTGISVLANIVRKRPKYIPKCVWVVLYLPLFRWKHLKIVYKHLE